MRSGSPPATDPAVRLLVAPFRSMTSKEPPGETRQPGRSEQVVRDPAPHVTARVSFLTRELKL